MKRLFIVLLALPLAAQTTPSTNPPESVFLGNFKQGSGPVSSTVGGIAGYSFAKDLAGFTPYVAGLYTQRGSMVTAGILRQVFQIGKLSSFCTATAGVASEQTTGLAGTLGCFAMYPIHKNVDLGAGGAVFGANVAGYDFGGRRVVPGFFLRYHTK